VMMSTTRAINSNIEFQHEENDDDLSFTDALDVHNDRDSNLLIEGDIGLVSSDSSTDDNDDDNESIVQTTTKTITTMQTTTITKPPLSSFAELAHTLKIQQNYSQNICFVTSRSTNANCVCFTAKRHNGEEVSQERAEWTPTAISNGCSTQGPLDTLEPLVADWIMFEKGKEKISGLHPREDLNMIERNTAYGVTGEADPATPGHFNCSVASLNDRKIVLYLDPSSGAPIAQTRVGGFPKVALKSVYVQMTDSWIPGVQYVDIYGVDCVTGELVHERKKP